MSITILILALALVIESSYLLYLSPALKKEKVKVKAKIKSTVRIVYLDSKLYEVGEQISLVDRDCIRTYSIVALYDDNDNEITKGDESAHSRKPLG